MRDLAGLPPEILIVPLAGHTTGHCGIAVRSADGWLLHAGDAYFFRGEMDLQEYHCTPMLRFYQSMMAVDNAMRRNNQARLRQLKTRHGHLVRLFCAHDTKELGMFPSQPAETVPAPTERLAQPV